MCKSVSGILPYCRLLLKGYKNLYLNTSQNALLIVNLKKLLKILNKQPDKI